MEGPVRILKPKDTKRVLPFAGPGKGFRQPRKDIHGLKEEAKGYY